MLPNQSLGRRARPISPGEKRVGASSEGSAAIRPRRSKAEQRAESLEQILDAAEYLFSKNGFHGVTLRNVAERVGIHTTLLHYYFEDKRNLFEAVFERRAGASCRRRMEALEQYEAEAGNHPTVEGALHAFPDTDLDLYMEGGEPWMNYAAFVARVSHTPEGVEMMKILFDPVVLKLVGILRRALPDYSDEDIFWSYHFVTGALMTTLARTGRIDHLSGGICRSDDFPAIKKRIAKFLAAGFLALKDCRRAKRTALSPDSYRAPSQAPVLTRATFSDREVSARRCRRSSSRPGPRSPGAGERPPR